MMAVEVAYRSDAPAVLEAMESWQADMQARHERVKEFDERHNPDGKLTLRIWRWPSYRIAYFEGDDAPEGWRRNKRGRIVPDKRTRAGKQIAAEIEAIHKSPLGTLAGRLPGMPEHTISGDRWLSPGIFLHDGAVYVHWEARPVSNARTSEFDEVDTAIWSELKLSEFYAAKEAFDRLPDKREG
jgi:hypothetical protein